MKMHVFLGLLILGFLLLGCAAPTGTNQQTYVGPGGTVTTTGTTSGADFKASIQNCTPGGVFTWSASGATSGGYGTATGQFEIVGRTPTGECHARYVLSGVGPSGQSGSYGVDYYFVIGADGDPEVVRVGSTATGN